MHKSSEIKFLTNERFSVSHNMISVWILMKERTYHSLNTVNINKIKILL
jgi:hypothetical protein